MKKVLLILSILLLLIISLLIIKAFLLPSRQFKVKVDEQIIVPDSLTLNLAEAIKFRTITYDSGQHLDSSAFKSFTNFISQKFSFVENQLTNIPVSPLSKLYCWKGKNQNLKPVVLMAHMDVVPPEGNWELDPFGGIIKDGFVYGRGSLDDKSSIFGILEACQILIREGFQPERSIYFAFGHDEEIGGNNGAKVISQWFEGNNIEAEFILDEGLLITDGMVPGISKPVALIGIAEKGYMTLELSVSEHSGHSSMPEKETSIGILSAAISKLEKEKFDAKLTGVANSFLQHIGPEMGFLKKVVFANTWLFEKLILNTYEKTPAGNALVRTTLAPTIFTAGIKENVIPENASAVVNLRILPGHSKNAIIDEIKNIIDDDRVKIKELRYNEASAISSTESFGYQKIDSTIRKIFPEAIVAPSLMIAATDSRHYSKVSKNIYRFLPIVLKKEDVESIHGKNEKISVEGYKNMIRFYYGLMKGL